MAEIQLDAQSRTEFGKGSARRLRAKGLVPAVVYGHGADCLHIALPGHDTQLALRQANALLRIVIDGGKGQLALPKQVQRDPVRGDLEHVDLIVVKAGEKVHVDVPITLVGDAEPGSLVMLETNSLNVTAEATSIPQEIEIDVTGLEIGSQVLVSDVKLPAGVAAVADPETLVVNITTPQEEKEEEPAEGEELEGEEAAEADDDTE